MDRLAKKLNLSDAQRQQIKHIMEKNREEMQQYRQQFTDNMQKLRAASTMDNYDAIQIDKLAKLQGDAFAKITVLRLQSKHDMMQVLTPKQQTKFKEMLNKKGWGRGGKHRSQQRPSQ